MKKKFHSKQCDARWRGIPFLLTYDQWLKIWIDSGHIEKMGCRKGDYVMSRFGDKGPYKIGNVKIIPVERNHSEVVLSDESRRIMREKALGRKHTKTAKAGMRKRQTGSGNSHTKLTESDVLAIRDLAGKMTHEMIGKKFGISRSNVGFIIARKSWTHI